MASMLHSFFFFFFFIFSTSTQAIPFSQRNFNVRKHGALGKGLRDDTQFFLNAWNRACQHGGHTKVIVPKGLFLVGPMILAGPCKGPIDFNLRGTLMAASSTLNQDHWITFRFVDRLSLYGGGRLDGQGASAWSSGGTRAINLRFDFVTNSNIGDITSYNSKTFHINVFSCKYLLFNKMKILAPEDSPNTDGIHLGDSDNIKIHNSIIATGDDCISMGSGSRNIDVFNVNCGPGHGISIGSLGKFSSDKDVEGITVRKSYLKGTQNGVRIKTWAPSNKLTLNNVTFDGIQMDDVNQPIIIDQNYCPHGECDKGQSSQVQIKNVWFTNIRGTSSSVLAVSLNCSSIAPCQNVNLKDINLRYTGPSSRLEDSAMATCSNVKGAASGVQNPPACV